MNQEENFAYIDGANLYEANKELGWKLDYFRFRIWLKDKYSVTRAYLFMGMIPKYAPLYTKLQEAGFTLVFKQTVYDGNGKPKGNCDADLVLQTICDYYERRCDKAIIVSSDGDYASTVKFLMERERIEAIVSPSNNCSILIKRTKVPIVYLDGIKKKITERPPVA
jgi:uncharacterized LabA/DUF88 family protein